MKKLHGPLGNPNLLHVAILTGLRLINIFDLPNQRERLLRTLSVLGKFSGLRVCCKGKVVVSAFFTI